MKEVTQRADIEKQQKNVQNHISQYCRYSKVAYFTAFPRQTRSHKQVEASPERKHAETQYIHYSQFDRPKETR